MKRNSLLYLLRGWIWGGCGGGEGVGLHQRDMEGRSSRRGPIRRGIQLALGDRGLGFDG